MGQNDIKVAITGDSSQLAQSVKKAEGSIREFSAASQNYVASLQGAVTSLVAAFGGLQLGAFFKDSIMLAANIEQADVALGSIATTLGKTSAEAIKYRDSLRDVNITTSAATNATAQFLRASLPLEGLNQLGQAAQGAAISYNMLGKEVISSSEALDKMVRAIVTGNVRELKTLGFQTMLLDLLRENKLATGEAATAVDSHARRLLVFNDVLKQSTSMMNLYSDSTGLAAKNISSSKRPLEELRLTLGNLFLPELTQASAAFYETLVDGQQWVKANKEALDDLKDTIKGISDFLVTMSKLEFTSIKSLAALEFNGWKSLFDLVGIEGIGDVLNGLDVTVQAIGTGIAALAASVPHLASLIKNTYNPVKAQQEADAIIAIYQKTADDLDRLVTRKNPYKKTTADKAQEAEQQRLAAEKKAAAEAQRIKDALGRLGEGDSGAAAQSAKESATAWKKVYADLKFEAAGYYDAQRQLIDQQAEEYRKAGVSAVVLEQWKNAEIKKLDEERFKAEQGWRTMSMEQLKQYNDLVKALHEEEKKAAQEATKAWEEDRQALEQVMTGIMPEHEAQVQAITDKYNKLRLTIARLAVTRPEMMDTNRAAGLLNGVSVAEQQALDDLAAKTEETFDQRMTTAITGWANNFSATLTDLLFDSKTTFGDIAQSFAKMVTQMIIQVQIIEPLLEGLLGKGRGSGGGSSGSSWLGTGLSLLGGIFGGGATTTDYMKLSGPAGPAKWINPDTLPKFAVGIDYVPHDMAAIIHKGERIIPASQNQPGAGAQISVPVTVNGGSKRMASELRQEIERTVEAVVRRHV